MRPFEASRQPGVHHAKSSFRVKVFYNWAAADKARDRASYSQKGQRLDACIGLLGMASIAYQHQ